VAVFSPMGKAILLIVVFVECVVGIAISVIAALIPYPFLQKWTITGIILLGLIMITLLVFSWIMNKTVSFRLK
jgi:hypothetical protein